MVRTHRVSNIAAIACLICAPWTGTLSAAQMASSATPGGPSAATINVSSAPASIAGRSRFTLSEPLPSLVTVKPVEPDIFAQRGWGRRGRWGRNGARSAIILGSVAAIAGAAVLVYADRPECSANHMASGCGYGTKVVGGAVLAGGVVSIVAGTLTWR
jgi:hypothetical protein